MKKILILMLAVVMAGTIAACGVGDVGGASSSAPAQSEDSKPEVSEISSKDMDDNLAGLEKYLVANSVISGQQVKMDPSFIGAKSGEKYEFGFEGKKNVTVELYEYDTSNLSDKAKVILDNVKNNGKFVILNNEIKATVSDSGKYIMIYRDSDNAEKNKTHQEEVTKLFQKFKK